MAVRAILLSVLIVSMVALSGCSGTLGEDSATTAIQTDTTTATTVPDESTTTTTPPTTATTGTTTATTSEPQYGDNLLYTTEVDTAVAMEANASKRANFTELTAAEQALFNQTYNCSCYVVQEEFRFNDEERIEYVNYEGQWYFFRVAIV